MATTKYKISEQVQRLLKGNPVISGRTHINDISLLVEQVANKLLKTEFFAVNMADGDSIPPNCMIYTYESVPISAYKPGKNRLTLPSIPISLPRNMGLFHISLVDSVDEGFVPIPSGMFGIIKPEELIGANSGIVWYETFGSTVIIHKDLRATGVNSVMVRLVGADLSTVDNYTILPISADMEADIVNTVFAILVQAPPADKKNND